MKKCFFLLLLALVCPACRNSQLGGPTYTVQVSPGAAAVPQGSTQTFTASVQSDGGPIGANPSWSLSSANLGTLSPTTGSQVSFTPGSNPGKSGTISASYNGVTGTAQIFIGGTLPAASAYGLLDDTISSPILEYNIPNPSDANGGDLCAFSGGTGSPSGSATLSTATGSGEYTVSGGSLKTVYDGGSSPTTDFGGWFAQWGYPTCGTEIPTNFSASGTYGAFTTLKFDIRANAETQVKLEWTGGSFAISLVSGGYMLADDQFHSVSIPLSSFTGIDTSKIKDIVFAAGANVSSETFYVDNMRFEK